MLNKRRKFSNYLTAGEEYIYNDSFISKIAHGEDFNEECLKSHNHYRAQHGCSPLHLSSQISSFSQEWACKIAAEDHFHHSHHPQYGENLFVAYLSNYSIPEIKGNEVVESWYSEHIFYPYDSHITREIISKAGHFTQTIWNKSRELGVGKAVSKNHRVYVVANYYPPGNILNRFVDNVPKKIHANSIYKQYTKRISSRSMYYHCAF
ncbi:Golgi-associated plant pathogenesis-related protein 1 [Parasteatoda tepidariorum]|uniref:Golgi-associated plant pathogenesis-related protein 1 n=1 Tax=Parasteatoda tepidariorum TaxID=114398 RepID=UPI001C728BA4|nr:Golgi-associated plant pathogenesis-related protein 1 isoform X1 [Parasteatoda tepidariorum]